MLNLNLISPEAKKEIKMKHWFSLVKTSGIFLTALSLITGVIFLAAGISLEGTWRGLNKEAARLIGENSAAYGAKIKTINGDLALAAMIQTNFVSGSCLLEKITGLIPPEISLNYLKIDMENKTVELRGQAPLRENLLALEKKLEESGLFAEVNIPLQSKLEKENIIFDINLKNSVSLCH
jgi:hypothetical protein